MFCRASEAESCSYEGVNGSTDASCDYSLSTNQRIGIYGGIVGFTIMVIVIRAVLCYLVVLPASHSLHSKMLISVLQAPVLFFDINPVGEYIAQVAILLVRHKLNIFS